MTNQLRNIIFITFLFCANILFGQETVVVGQVFDKFTNDPLASVDVYFKNTNVGVQTNDEGYFLIRYSGKEDKLVFSLIGYNTEQIKIKPGESVGIQILMEEKENYLSEVFVLPGANPANDLMRKVRRKRTENNYNSLIFNSVEQSAVFLGKDDNHRWNQSLYKQFVKGNLSKTDSALLVPLYIEQSEFKQSENKKEQLSKNTFNTSKSVVLAVSQLLNGMDEKINFYENSVPILGKSIVSPLANIGGAYYTYYLKDSIQTDSGKQYEIQFWSKNKKNLAFNGNFRVDSASLALTRIDVQLPRQANLNFIHNLSINQDFTDKNGRWIPKFETENWSLTYDVIADSVNKKPELIISRSSSFSFDEMRTIAQNQTFADTKYSEQTITAHIDSINNTPLFKLAKFVADAAFTGYIKAWKFDIGNIMTVARLTEQEGLRLALPIRTNENLWKNFMLGGTTAYGFGEKKWQYVGEIGWNIFSQKNVIAELKYSNEYHWVNYDKNDFLWHEKPLASYDENISTTLLSLKKGINNSRRENFSFSLKNDWNDDVETQYIAGQQILFGNDRLPLLKNQMEYPNLKTQYLTIATRFSFNERVINEHFQRIYLYNNKPVIYGIAEAGKFMLGDESGYYGHISTQILQKGRFTLGEWEYFAEAGKIFGNVPYPLLKFFNTKANGGYNIFQFSLMKFFEYPLDTYASFHSQITTNGIIFNQIPLIKRLNLREIASFNIGYGTLSDSHTQWLDFPANASKMKYPYSEVSIGFTNFLKVVSVQSIWRLTDTNKATVKPWALAIYVNLGL